MKVPSIPQLSSLGDFANTKNGSSQAVGQLVSIISGLFFLFVFPVLVVCSLPFAAFLSPILIPITLIIGGNPVPWILGFCADSVTRTWDFIGTLGPRIFDRSAPHPSYVHDGEFPTVENVPWSQRGDFALFRISNYFRKMAISLITATYKALFDYKAQPISDEEMGQVFSTSTYSRFLKRVANNKLPAFVAKSGITLANDATYYVCDLSFVSKVKTYKGMYSAGTVSVWKVTEKKGGKKSDDPFRARKDDEWPEVRPICIELTHSDGAKVVVRPGDAAWDGAKLFVMQGATHMGDLTEHPKIHFPYDCMAAYTLRLPESHLLKKLLLPHQRFTLALNDTVLNNYFLSIVINPWMTQSPFDVGPPEVRKYLQECKTSFTFDTEPFPDTSVKNTPFNVFLMRYFSLTHQFVSEVVNTRPDEFRDENVQQWADDIASIVPGFPAGKDIIKGDTIIDVVAKIIWNISINHCVDHYSYYCIPWAKNPWRVRVPPPKSPQDKVDFNKVMNRVDMWKLAQCQDVFFYTGASHTMAKIDYKFKDTTLKSLNEWYIAEMKKVDSIKDKARIMELQAIGQSIDF